jgi:hypothetical protein
MIVVFVGFTLTNSKLKNVYTVRFMCRRFQSKFVRQSSIMCELRIRLDVMDTWSFCSKHKFLQSCLLLGAVIES